MTGVASQSILHPLALNSASSPAKGKQRMPRRLYHILCSGLSEVRVRLLSSLRP